MTLALTPTTGSGRTWKIVVIYKWSQCCPSHKRFHKNPEQLEHSVIIIPLEVSFSSFSLQSHSNTISGVLKSHGQINHFPFLLLFQPVTAFHQQDAQNYRSWCNQSETTFRINCRLLAKVWFFNDFPLQIRD